MTNSIKERGIIQPLIVRKSNDQNDKYELIAGERRWQAAQSAGLHEVPVEIIQADNLKSLELAIIENVQRKDLNPIEEAESYRNLIENFDYDQEMVSKFIGKSRSHITNLLRILELDKFFFDLLNEGKISMGHARALIGKKPTEFDVDTLNKIISGKISVRNLEINKNKLSNTEFILINDGWINSLNFESFQNINNLFPNNKLNDKAKNFLKNFNDSLDVIDLVIAIFIPPSTF